MTELEIEYVAPASLRGAPYNPRKMPDDQMRLLMRGIEEFGLVDPIIVNSRTGFIVGGHQRCEAAKRLKLAKVPTVYLSLTDEQEKALNLALNKIHGEWDLGLLKDVLEDLDTGSIDLELTGFTEAEVEALLTSVPPEQEANEGLCDPDEAPDVDEKEPPITQPGDLIELGRHRLLCGDSTKLADAERLMDGAKADMLWTDPPYNVAYEGGTTEKLTIQNDKMGARAFRTFLLDAYQAADASLRPGAAVYITYADRETLAFHLAWESVEWHLSSVLVWVKNSFTLGRSDYHSAHEPMIYGWKPGAAHYFVDDRSQDSTWEHDKPKRNGEHPTMKPVELVAKAVKNSTRSGEKVLDLFGGSGSTLIACEQEGRAAYLMELDPRYCDVIVARWEKFTGKKAVRPER